MLDKKLFDYDEKNKKHNGLEAMIAGLYAALVEAKMNGQPYKRIEEAIAKYEKKLEREKEKV